MSLELVTLRVLEGPNIYQPQPGVYLLLRSDKDRSRRLRDALKDAAQAAGLVLGFLECMARPWAGEQGVALTCSFATPQPEIGAALARYVVEGINRRLAGDEEWDADGPLYEIGKQRRRASPPVEAVQLVAEARRRDLPTLLHADGSLRIGYGGPGWQWDATPQAAERPAPPWERIGSAPVIAVTGGSAAEVARMVAQRLGAERRVALVLDAGFEETRRALHDSAADTIVLALRTRDLVDRGAAFERCAASAIVGGLAGPAGAGWSEEEQLRALGLPLLLTSPGGRALIASDMEALAGVLGYAACPVDAVSSVGEAASLLAELALA
jgi:hypothetical protein